MSCVDYFNHARKFTAIAFCSGAIAGLEGITPGFVNAWSAIIIGAVTAVCCAFAIRIKGRFYDDSADAWGVHGVGGLVGNVMTGMRFRLDEDEKYAGSDIINMDKIACTEKLTPAASMSNVAAIGQASV